jgi:hypothetical protein
MLGRKLEEKEKMTCKHTLFHVPQLEVYITAIISKIVYNI